MIFIQTPLNLICMFFIGINQHLEIVIRQRIPSIIALINKTIDELNAELDRIGRPIGEDGGVYNWTFMYSGCLVIREIDFNLFLT